MYSGENMKYDERLSIRVDEMTKNVAERIADSEGVSFPDYIRNAIMYEIRRGINKDHIDIEIVKGIIEGGIDEADRVTMSGYKVAYKVVDGHIVEAMWADVNDALYGSPSVSKADDPDEMVMKLPLRVVAFNSGLGVLVVA